MDEATLRSGLSISGSATPFIASRTFSASSTCGSILLVLSENDEFSLPITQAELGETMGLSAIHVNRALQVLRSEGLIVLKSHLLAILDIDRLREVSSFNPNYLHLRAGRGISRRRIQLIDRPSGCPG